MVKNKLKKLFLDNFDRRKREVLTQLDEQTLRDYGFSALKERLVALDSSITKLTEQKSVQENPGLCYVELGKWNEDLELLKREAAKFKRALSVANELEFKVSYNFTDNGFSLKFDTGNTEDLYEQIKVVLQAEERPRISRLELASGEDGLTGRKFERSRSFLADNGNSRESGRTPLLNKQFLPQQSLKAQQVTVTTPTASSRDNLFKSIEPIPKKNQFQEFSSQAEENQLRLSSSELVWDDSEIIVGGGLAVQARPPSVSKKESSSNFVKKLSIIEPPLLPILTPKQPADQIALKPASSAKAYQSYRKIATLPVNERSAPAPPPIVPKEVGVISNQAIDESKLKLILAELKTSQNIFDRIEFVNNTFKCNYSKILRASLSERLHCEVKIDESKNKIQVKTSLTKKEIQALREFNITLIQ